MRSSKTIQTSKSRTTLDSIQDIRRQRRKTAILCLHNTVDGIKKRLKSQAYTKLIMQSAKHYQTTHKIKFIAYFSQAFFKRKELSAFDRLVRYRMHGRIIDRAVSLLALKYKVIQKERLHYGLQKLRPTHNEAKVEFKRHGPANKPIATLISPRYSQMSQRSNIFSVSQDSNDEGHGPIYEDKKVYGSVDIDSLRHENEELKRMVLSDEAKDSLLKMQRYNRFNYNTQTEKILKEPITKELRRLEKMKNQSKQMRGKFYDNQLTITCLYNHIRLVCEMNREMGQAAGEKDKLTQLEKKISELNFEHKKEINEYKRKLLLSGGSRKSHQLSQSQISFGQKEELLTHDEVTTMNVLISALKAKKFKDIKRETNHFIKKSTHQELINLMKQLASFVQEMEGLEGGSRVKQKQKQQISSFISSLDKSLRTDRVDELQSLKNKHKSQPHLNQLSVLLQTIINVSSQLKKYKKKDTSSAEKFKSAEKQKLKKTVEKENQELRRQLKGLQAKNNELSIELQRLKDSLKKSDRVHPSLLPKKSFEKEDEPQMLAKTPEKTARTAGDKSQINALKSQNERLKKEIQTQSKKIQESKEDKHLEKQYYDAQRCWEAIIKKKEEHQSYKIALVNFKKAHDESIFCDIFQMLQKSDTDSFKITNQIKTIANAFSDGSWKRKQNTLTIKEQGEPYDHINKIVELLVSSNQEKEQAAQSIKEIESIKSKNKSLTQSLNQTKEENTKLKSEVKEKNSLLMKQKSKSAEKSQSQKQIASYQGQINQLKSSIEGRNKQIQDLKHQNQQLNQQKQRIQTQLDNAINSNKESNIEIQRLNNSLATLKAQHKKSFQATQSNSERKKLEAKIRQLQKALETSKATAKDYAQLLKEEKQEKSNIFLMMEEKEQEYQVNRQSEQEQWKKDRSQKEIQIIQLKHSYEQTQKNVEQISIQVNKLTNENQQIKKHKDMIEFNLKNQIEHKENEIRNIKMVLQQKQMRCVDLQNQLEMQVMRMNSELEIKDSQIEYLNKEIDLLKGQIKELKLRLQQENREIKNQYESLNKHMKEQIKIRKQSSSLVSHQVNQYSQISHNVAKSSTIMTHSQDHEKLQLRRQLELANKQIAAFFKSSETQKRQLRQYIQKLNNQLQMQTVVYNEEKKILKESIERARTEQYEIHHDKLRKLREDVQTLREDNEKLTSIIDNNEHAFNSLISEHREMSQKISQLTRTNTQLTDENADLLADLHRSQKEIQGLNLQLRSLQEKLSLLQTEVQSAMGRKGYKDEEALQQQFQSIVDNLEHEKRTLQTKVTEQNINIIELHKQILKLESDLHKSTISFKSGREGGDYSRYLQEKIKDNQREAKRLVDNEKSLINKIQSLMKSLATLEREKMEYHSFRREREIELSMQRNSGQRDIIVFQEKISKLQELLVQKERQYSSKLQRSRVDPPLSQVNTSEYETRIRQLQDHNRRLVLDIDKLKITIDGLRKERASLDSQIQAKSQAVIEARLLATKYADLQADYRQLQGKVSVYEHQITVIREQREEASQSHDVSQIQLEMLSQRTLLSKKDQQIQWVKSQLSLRENQIHRLRSAQIDLSNQLHRLQQSLKNLQSVHQKYNLQVQSHSQTRHLMKSSQEFYKNELNRIKDKEQEASQSLIMNNQNIRILNQSYQQLSNDYKKLKDEAEGRKMEAEALKQIVYQLDQEFQMGGDDEELQLRVLQKISYEISYLLQTNKKLKTKCENLQISIYQTSTQASQQTFIFSLHNMTQNLLYSLKNEHILNPQELGPNLKQLLVDSSNSSQVYMANLQIFLKTMIMTVMRDSYRRKYNEKGSILRRTDQNFTQVISQDVIEMRQEIRQ